MPAMERIRVKHGDAVTVSWTTGVDLTDETPQVIVAGYPGKPARVTRTGVVQGDPTAGVVGLELETADYADGVLDERPVPYYVEVKLAGPVTHPNYGYGRLLVTRALD